MIIKTLMENTSSSPQFKKEHGLSFYIEACGHKILFDAGQTSAFLENADRMDVNLSEVDIAVLSHGHYDHSGGFDAFLDRNHKANLYVNEHAFGDFYSGKEKPIGIDVILKKKGRIIITSDYTKLEEGLELFTCNSLERKYSTDSRGLYHKIGSDFKEDIFSHEQYLLITEQEKRVLISGCSHKGILNIVEWFQPNVLVGGFHFKGIEMNQTGADKLNHYAEELKEFDTTYYTCHCTGREQYEYLKETMNAQVAYLAAGDILEI